MKVAVIGAGIAGTSSARALAERGHAVTLFEQFQLGHSKGSSHGRSRIIRKAYPDPYYTALMNEAYGLWHEVQSLSREQIVFEPGLLYFGSFESEGLRNVHNGLQEMGVAHELLDHDQARRVFPALRLRPGEIGILTPKAGWVNAELAIRALTERLLDLGGRIVDGTRVDPEELKRQFDAVVVCAGAWIKDLLAVPVRITLQTFGYIEPDHRQPLDGPVWIEDGPDFFYGFPSEPASTSFKIGIHRAGPVVDPDQLNRPAPYDQSEAIAGVAARRFGVKEADYLFQSCLYTSTPDEDFLFGRFGDDGYFLSACSGHGFKFGPWLGIKMADFVEGTDQPENYPRFCWPKPLLEA